MPITTEIALEAVPRKKSYKITDSNGLYLTVEPSGSKLWRFRYRFGGKQNNLSCGVFPKVSLDKARRRRDEFRALLAEGVNPSAHAKAERAAKVADELRLSAATRFTLDSDGALSFRLGSKCLALTPAETLELRSFLNATRAVKTKVMPCP